MQVHGYMPPQADIARIRPGFDDAGSVEEILGRPSSSGVLRDSAWYYVQSTVENFTYHAPRVVDRTVLAVQFDQNGVVRGVARYGLEDGRIINLDHPHHRDRRPRDGRARAAVRQPAEPRRRAVPGPVSRGLTARRIPHQRSVVR